MHVCVCKAKSLRVCGTAGDWCNSERGLIVGRQARARGRAERVGSQEKSAWSAKRFPRAAAPARKKTHRAAWAEADVSARRGGVCLPCRGVGSWGAEVWVGGEGSSSLGLSPGWLRGEMNCKEGGDSP